MPVLCGWRFSHDIAANNQDVNRDGIVDILDLVLAGKHRGEIYLP
ncbi:MAG: hypothetical protein ACE5PV_24600 [Candidatus Poribacteria bacterium]